MKKVKQIICIIMAALILITAPVTTYMEAQATAEVVTAGVLEYLLGLFGVSVGLGNQSDFWSQSNMDYISDCIANGDVISMGDYGDVDFSDSQSVYNWINTVSSIDGFLVGSGNLGLGEEIAKTIKNNCVKLDMISYHNTGTTATGAMNDYINEFVGDYNASSEALAEDIRDCFTVIQGGGDFNDDDDDEETKAERRKKFLRTFSAVMSGCMLGGFTGMPLAALKEASETEYNEYDAAFEDGSFFDGTYQTDADGNYVYYIGSSSQSFLVSGQRVPQLIDCTLSYKICGWINGSNVMFVKESGNFSLPLAENGYNVPFVSYTDYFGNIPLYSTRDACIAALQADDFSDAENIQDNPYTGFKDSVSTAGAVLGSALAGLISSLSSLSALANICPGLYDVSDSNTGTSDALISVEEYLTGATPSPDPDPGTETGTDYSGMLSKILSAIKSVVTAINNLPSKLVTAFANKFMTAQGLTKLINGLPDAFVLAFKTMLTAIFPNSLAVETAVLGLENIIVQALPDAMAARIIEIFPDAEAVGNAIIGFPDAVAEACKGIAINIPEIKIPEIVIPEIVIPEIEVPQPKVDIEFNPEITVQNDYTGLEAMIVGAITGAVTSVLTDLFVPDEVVTMDKVATMKSYFTFVDDMELIIASFQKSVFGVTPSPFLKIPIGKPNSKYDYGTGNYIIFDVSWYGPYKEFGDKIILALVWAFFIWKIFVLLPGIVSGSVGGFIMGKDIKVTNELNKYYANDSFRDQLNRYDSGFNGKGNGRDN